RPVPHSPHAPVRACPVSDADSRTMCPVVHSDPCQRTPCIRTSIDSPPQDVGTRRSHNEEDEAYLETAQEDHVILPLVGDNDPAYGLLLTAWPGWPTRPLLPELTPGHRCPFHGLTVRRESEWMCGAPPAPPNAQALG